MKSKTHIIQKQRYEIKTRRQNTAMDMQERLGEINTSYVLPLLAKKLDKHFSDQSIITIGRLEIELGKIKKDTTDRDWAYLIMEKLEDQFNILQENSSLKIIASAKTYIADSWIYFLKHGVLPADAVYRSVAELLMAVTACGESEKESIRKYLFEETDVNILKRLISNSNTGILKFHFDLLTNTDSGDGFYQLKKEIDQLVIQQKQKKFGLTPTDLAIFRDSLLNYVFKILVTAEINRRTSVTELITEIQSFAKKEILKFQHRKNDIGVNKIFQASQNKFDKEVDGKKEDSINDIEQHKELASLPEKEMFISNAGLCLVTAWLTPLFKETGLIDEGNFIDKEKQQHAIFLLHFLATKEMQPTEELLVLPKLLCGWPLQMPAINTMPFSEKEKTECDDLLKSIIQHWTVLKNTSADGLRESFLQRSGKLTEGEEQFLLQPEQQSIDILLEQVPWSFRFTRLPWMKKPLQTEWY